MTPEEKALLIETRDIAQESYQMLKSIRRANRVGAAFKIVYWVIILGLSFGAYWLIQPYVDLLKGSFGAEPSATEATTEESGFSGALDNLKEIRQFYR
jgi:hypothetical protein